MLATNRLLVQALVLILGFTRAHAQFGECPAFRRGDTNIDGTVDLSDAVTTLLYLFSAGGNPPCLDAADADDSGTIELTDAVYTLSYLFLGKSEPPAPGPVECGRDETFDDLQCASNPSCERTSSLRDFSAFTTFEARQEPAFGYCPDLDRPYKAVIVRKQDGSHAVTLTHLRLGMEGVDECLPPHRGSECYVPEVDPERALTSDETAALLALFAAVEVFAERDNICYCVAIDPCRVDVFSWDGEDVSNFPCSAPRTNDQQASLLLGFINSLRLTR